MTSFHNNDPSWANESQNEGQPGSAKPKPANVESKKSKKRDRNNNDDDEETEHGRCCSCDNVGCCCKFIWLATFIGVVLIVISVFMIAAGNIGPGLVMLFAGILVAGCWLSYWIKCHGGKCV